MIQLDVCDSTSCKEAVTHVLKSEGRIDVLINNAGMGIAGPAETTSDEDALLQFETNFFGAVRMSKEVLPIMRTQGHGKIINITSVAAIIPIAFQSMYSASKAALEMFSQALSMEVSDFRITVTSIEFGDMKTGFTQNRKVLDEFQESGNTCVYDDMFEKSLGTMVHDEQNASLPTKEAKLIYKTALKKNPKPVIVCGFKYKLVVRLRRFLPIRFSHFLIKKVYAK